VVQSGGSRGTDVHARAKANRLQPFKDGDIFCAVRGTAFIVRNNAFVSALTGAFDAFFTSSFGSFSAIFIGFSAYFSLKNAPAAIQIF
jgi:hypothetical protein